jgi:hypothetical protein
MAQWLVIVSWAAVILGLLTALAIQSAANETASDVPLQVALPAVLQDAPPSMLFRSQ